MNLVPILPHYLTRPALAKQNIVQQWDGVIMIKVGRHINERMGKIKSV